MVMIIIATLTSWVLHAENGNAKPKRLAVVELSESYLRDEADYTAELGTQALLTDCLHQLPPPRTGRLLRKLTQTNKSEKILVEIHEDFI